MFHHYWCRRLLMCNQPDMCHHYWCRCLQMCNQPHVCHGRWNCHLHICCCRCIQICNISHIICCRHHCHLTSMDRLSAVCQCRHNLLITVSLWYKMNGHLHQLTCQHISVGHRCHCLHGGRHRGICLPHRCNRSQTNCHYGQCWPTWYHQSLMLCRLQLHRCFHRGNVSRSTTMLFQTGISALVRHYTLTQSTQRSSSSSRAPAPLPPVWQTNVTSIPARNVQPTTCTKYPIFYILMSEVFSLKLTIFVCVMQNFQMWHRLHYKVLASQKHSLWYG